MKPLRVLIVDEESDWYSLLAQIFSEFEEHAKAVIAKNYEEALDLINNQRFELAILDLKLPGKISSSNELGFDLAKHIRASEQNSECALVMLTGYSTPARKVQALLNLRINRFLSKDTFDEGVFVQEAKAAMFDASIERAKRERANKHIMTFDFRGRQLTALHLSRPGGDHSFSLEDPQPEFKLESLTNRSDSINLVLSPPLREYLRESWRDQASSIGQDVYRELTSHPDVHAGLSFIRTTRETTPDNVWLRFRGPRNYLGVPFELLKDGEDYLILSHPIQRQVPRSAASHKGELFYDFLEHLVQNKQKLRILLIASNPSSRLEAVDREVQKLHAQLDMSLSRLGVPYEICPVPSVQATLKHFTESLQEYKPHIIHYAGPGRYDDEKPERSGVYLIDNGQLQPMRADSLNGLLRSCGTRLFFLSCCLGARTGDWVGRSDFLGIMDAIVQADVPTVIGYRWYVSDGGARDFALAFYDHLFPGFCIEDAVYSARRDLSINRGRDDETWASPVVVVQN